MPSARRAGKLPSEVRVLSSRTLATAEAKAPPTVASVPYKGVRRVPRRSKVEAALPLDIRQLHGYGLLKAGTEGSVLLRSSDGTRIATAQIEVETTSLCLRLDGCSRSVPTEIRIGRTACPFGGSRRWFRCPQCTSHRLLLYADSDGSFSCRRCLKLVFSSQDETKMQRLRRKQSRIESKLSGTYQCARPKGMHWTTFRHISCELNSVLVKHDHLRAESARKLLDRIGWPRGYERYQSSIRSDVS